MSRTMFVVTGHSTEQEIDKRIKLLERDWKQHSNEFPDIRDPTKHWHTFGGTTGLYRALWPANGVRVFPRWIFSGDRVKWDEWFEQGYRYPSQFVHGQPGVIGTYSGILESENLLGIEPVFQAGYLKVCQAFADAGLETLSKTLALNPREIHDLGQMLFFCLCHVAHKLSSQTQFRSHHCSPGATSTAGVSSGDRVRSF